MTDLPAWQTDWYAALRRHRAIAVVRADRVAVAVELGTAVAAGGMRLVEVAWNGDRPAEQVARLRSQLPPDCWVGVGTLQHPDHLREAIAAGAQFCFMPHGDPDLVRLARDRQIPAVPGALTPTEIWQAWQWGAACVKVFPASALGGPAYLRALAPVLSAVPLVPTGGATLDNAAAFLEAGAIAVGLSGDLFPAAARAGNWAIARERARELVARLAPWRIG